MSAPWDNYAQAQPPAQAGPWAKYGAPGENPERYTQLHAQLSALPPAQRSQAIAALSPADRQVIAEGQRANAQAAMSPAAQQQRLQQAQAQNVANMGTLGRFWTGIGEGANGVVQGVKENIIDRGLDLVDPLQSSPGNLVTGGAPTTRVAQDQAQVANERQLAAALNATTAGKIGNITGSIMESSPLLLIPGGGEGVLARIGLGAGAGALAGYMAPQASNSENSANTVLGGVAGAAAPAIGTGTRAALVGAATPEARALINAGVKLTPGQTLGGAAKRIEDGLTSVPLMGDTIRNAQLRSLQSFNTAAMNDALAPIGGSIPTGTAAGYDTINAGLQATRGAYDAALNGTTTHADAQFMASLAHRINALPARVQQKVLDVLDSRVFPAINESGGTLSGQQFKDMTSGVLGDMRAMGRSTDPVERNASQALGSVLGDMNDAFARSNGAARAAKLSAADRAYRGFVKLQDAAAHTSQNAPGVFTPAQLRAAVKRGDASKGKAAFARGNAHMQDLADTAGKVLPSTVPDSGTPYRMFVGAGSLGGVGSLASLAGLGTLSHATLPAAALMGLTALPYTRAGSRVAQSLLAPDIGAVRGGADRLLRLLGGFGQSRLMPVLVNGQRAFAASPPVAAALPAPATLPSN